MSTLATLAFIGVAAGAGGYLAMRPTVVDGRVIAADLKASSKDGKLTDIICDREVPVGPDGALFQCNVRATDGSTAKVQMSLDRAGKYKMVKILDSTLPTR